jgi:hypothetical protein
MHGLLAHFEEVYLSRRGFNRNQCHVHLQDEDGAMDYSDEDEEDMELPFQFERHSSPLNETPDVVMMEWINHSPDPSNATAALEYDLKMSLTQMQGVLFL